MPTQKSLNSVVNHSVSATNEAHNEGLRLEINPALFNTEYQNAPKYSLNFVNPEPVDGFSIQNNKSHKNEILVTPQFDCIEPNEEGGYTAHFSYLNNTDETVSLPVGPKNHLVGARNNDQPKDRDKDRDKDKDNKSNQHNNSYSVKSLEKSKSEDHSEGHENNSPQYIDQGQPTEFMPGASSRYPQSAFTVDFNNGSLIWFLDKQKVVVNKHAQQCADFIDFTPDNPNDLSELYPDLPGNQNIPIPETQVAGFQLNDEIPTPIVQGMVRVSPAEPIAENLQKILTKYNAEVIGEPIGDSYWLRLDMTKIDVTHLVDNLGSINRLLGSDDYIYKASFVNLESAKTLAALTELLMEESVAGAAPNIIFEHPEQSVKTYEDHNFPPDEDHNFPPDPDPYKISVEAQDSWWLNEQSTRVTEAWEHNMGYSISEKRPVRLGVIDLGFAGLKQYMALNVDLSEKQILWQKGFRFGPGNTTPIPWTTPIGGTTVDYLHTEDQSLGCDAAPDPGGCKTNYNTPGDHGTQVISTLNSMVNNGTGIAGVAPQTEIIPFKIGDGQHFRLENLEGALQKINNDAVQLQLDVINMSFGPGIYDFLIEWVDKLIYQKNINDLQENIHRKQILGNVSRYIKNLSGQHNITFVVAAGNSSYDVEHNYFANFSTLFNDIILVGALEDSSAAANPANDLHRALYPLPADTPNIDQSKQRSTGSNFGPKIDIWAPGKDMYALGARGLNTSTGLPIIQIYPWGGTSAAAPVVAGTIALMKAVNINLSTQDIKAHLKLATTSQSNMDYTVRGLPFYVEGDSYTDDAAGRYGCSFVLPTKSPTGEDIYPIKGVHCGLLQPQLVTTRHLDAKKLMERLNAPLAESFSGQIKSTSTGLELRTASGTAYTLMWSNTSDGSFIEDIYAQDLTDTIGSRYVPVGSLIDQPVEVEVIGLLDTTDNTLHFNEIHSITPPNNGCMVNEIVTNTDWVRYNSLSEPKNAVEVGLYKSRVKITPTSDGRIPTPIWSIINASDLAVCTNCTYNFWYDYVIPTGYFVNSASVELQADDTTNVYVNSQWIGLSPYTFGDTSTPKSLVIPPEVMNTVQGSSVPVALMLSNYNKSSPSSSNGAAVAAKFTIQVCPNP